MSASAQPQAPEPQPLSEGARLLNTYIDPPRTFNDLRRKATWFVPWLLIALFGYGFIGAAAQKIGFAQLSQNEMHANPKQAERIDAMPADQRQKALEVSATITKVFAFASPFIFLLIAVIIAAVLMGTFNFALGAELKFGAALAVVMYAYLPSLVKSVLAIASIYAGASPEGFLMRNPVASNLGALVDITQHPVLFAAGTWVDIFSIWIVVLMGIGFACVARVKRASALGVVFGWYILIALISTGFAALFA